MGILDDLKQQAEKQQDTPSTAAPPTVGSDEFYREHVKARMLTAFNFLTELVNQVNSMQLDVRADYPFKPDGKPVTLMQRGYKVFSDHITDPRQITLGFICALANPTTCEVQGRVPVMTQSEMLERYQFKYEKQEQKDPRQIVIGARFKLVGPLQIKFILQFDGSKQVIKLLVSNFAGAGTSQYNLKPEQLDEAFLDHLGKYLLRKEADLFKEEISDDVKAMLRKKLQEEQQQREKELKEAEDRLKTEEAARKQNSTTSQLKKAVSHTVTENTDKLKKAMNERLKRVMNTQVAKGKESLKGMFGKLKKQVQTPQQTPPVQSTTQRTPPASIPPTKPAQTHQQATAKTVMSAQIKTPATVTPPVAAVAQARVPVVPAKTQQPQPVAAEAPTQSASVSPASIKTAAEPAVVANSKPANPPLHAVVQTAPVKKTKPPKVYNAPPNNPFLKPEPPGEPPVDAAEPEAKTPAELPALEFTPVAVASSRPDLTPESLEEDLARIIERDKQNMPQPTPDSKKTTNPFLQTSATKVAAQTATPPVANERPRPHLKSGELNTSLSDVMPITRQAVSAKDTTAPEAKNSTPNPLLNPEELDIDLSDNLVPPQNDDSKENS